MAANQAMLSPISMLISSLSPFQPKPTRLGPDNYKYFKKRVCVSFVGSGEGDRCEGCQRKRYAHKKISHEKEWTYKTCTDLETTDAYGVLRFSGSFTKKARFIRVENETKPSDLIEHLFHERGWNLKKPNLIISVTGGAQKFSLPYMVKKAFKRGLIKASASTDAWIITGGTNTGVMRLVGDAVADEGRAYKCDFTIMGIATFGKIAHRNQLINEGKENEIDYGKYAGLISNSNKPKKTDQSTNASKSVPDALLDPNHTHFILVDDGSETKFGREIEFRAKLEAELKKGRSLKYYKRKREESNQLSSDLSASQGSRISVDEGTNEPIPMILIVVQGGPNTLETVRGCIEQEIPVLVLKDSKGAADLIADAIVKDPQNDSEIKELIEKSTMMKKDDKRITKAVESLGKILAANRKLINVFHFNSEENSYDIEMPILKALLNAPNNTFYENLKLSMFWNRADVAEEYIFTGEEEFKPGQLEALMEIALLENKPKFVEMLLENGLNLKLFLTSQRLISFYEKHDNHSLEKKSPFFRLTKKYLKGEKLRIEDIRRFLKTYSYKRFKARFLEDVTDEEDEIVPYPEMNMFIWALLMNRQTIAKIFWRIGRHQIQTALFACHLLKSLAQELPDLETTLIAHANKYEEMACHILQTIDETHSNTPTNQVKELLLAESPYYYLDSLEIAVEAKCMDFFSLNPVQNLLTSIWNGYAEETSGLMSYIKYVMACFSFGILSPILVKYQPMITNPVEPSVKKEPKDEDINIIEKPKKKEKNPIVIQVNDVEVTETELDKLNAEPVSTENDEKDAQAVQNRLTRLQQYFRIVRQFLTSPRVIFFYEISFFCIFLTLFSFLLLCKFTYYDNLPRSSTYRVNSSVLNGPYSVKPQQSSHFIEYLLFFWVIMFAVEEIVQFTFTNNESTLANKLLDYFGSRWNYLDSFGCIVFFVGAFFRVASIFQASPVLFKTAKIILAIDLTIWFLRLLHVALIFKNLGPKLVMLQKMMYDLLFFLVIMAVFIFTFAITTQATMYADNQANMMLVKKLIDKAYWPIFGDLRIIDELTLSDCKPNSTIPCPEKSGVVYSYIVLMIYIIIANVVLINLLIAMFSSTFQTVQDNADKIWRFQRYNLVFEYVDSSLFSPPINIISYIMTAVSLVANRIRKKKKVQGEPEIAEDILRLEKTFAEEYLRQSAKEESESLINRVKSNSDKLDYMEQKLAELTNDKIEILTAIHGMAKALQASSINMDNYLSDSLARSGKMKNLSFSSN